MVLAERFQQSAFSRNDEKSPVICGITKICFAQSSPHLAPKDRALLRYGDEGIMSLSLFSLLKGHALTRQTDRHTSLRKRVPDRGGCLANHITSIRKLSHANARNHCIGVYFPAVMLLVEPYHCSGRCE